MDLKPIRTVKNIACAIADYEIGVHEAITMPLGQFVWAWDDDAEHVMFGALTGVHRTLNGTRYIIVGKLNFPVEYSHIASVSEPICPQVIDRDNYVHRIVGMDLKSNAYITARGRLIPVSECKPIEYTGGEPQATEGLADIPNRDREEGV